MAIQKEHRLTEREKTFCREYVKTANGGQSVIKAGYKAKDIFSASVTANRLLKTSKIQAEINRITGNKERKAIMEAQEVMELYTAIARGEVKDQFGLDASLSDRIKAINEIAKRTVDVENRKQGKADAVLQIKLDWKRDDNNA